jgi:Tfp pilus assembly major pilin PilA
MSVPNHGNRTTKTTSNATYTNPITRRNSKKKKQKAYFKRLTSTARNTSRTSTPNLRSAN